MRCAVVVPEWRVEQIFLSAFSRSMGSYQEPSGPLYIAASLIAAGHQVILLDGALLDQETIVRRAREFGAELVGSYVVAPLWSSARDLARRLAVALPCAYQVVGGPWPSGVRGETLEECPALDAAVVGEGEHTVCRLAAVVEDGGEPVDIPGVVFRDRRSGLLVDNGDRPPVRDLDSLPFPARHLMGDDIQLCSLPPGGYRRRPVAHLIGSRGCTNRCIYCFHPEEERVIRFRSAESMFEEVLECTERYGFREIRFLDDNFTADRERVLAFCELMLRNGNETPWYVSSRVDTVDCGMLRLMKKAGCWAVLYGIESGVQKNLDTLRKNVTLDQVRQAVADTRAAGIRMFTPFMFGIPGETFEEGLETIRFACELSPYYANFNTITPFPGTDLWDRAEEYGTVDRETDRLTFQGAAFVPHTMTVEQIERLRQIAFRRFYTRPGFALRWLAGMRSLDDLLTVARGGLSFLTMWLQRNAFRFEPRGRATVGRDDG